MVHYHQKKFQKSNIAEVSKLSNIKTKVDHLIEEYGIDSKALE